MKKVAHLAVLLLLLVSRFAIAECQHESVYVYHYDISFNGASYNKATGLVTVNFSSSFIRAERTGTACHWTSYTNATYTVNVDGVTRSVSKDGDGARVGGSFSVSVPANSANNITITGSGSKLSISGESIGSPNVPGFNERPVAAARVLTTTEDNDGTVTLLASDGDGDSLSYSLVTAPNSSHGTASVSGNKATFTPRPDWNGTTSFTYRAFDGQEYSTPATVSVTTTPVNDPPSVSDRLMSLNEDTTSTLTLSVTDVDLSFEGDSHIWEIVSAPNAAHGSASISGNKLTFTPAANWNGTTTLTYRAKDSKGAYSAVKTVTITVNEVNDAPVANNRNMTTAEDTAGNVTLVASDIDGDSLTYSLVTPPNSAHGTVTISGNVATFTPKPNWNGTTSFTYRANDGTANSNTATVSVTVTPVNDGPAVNDATLTLDEDTTGTLTLAVTDVDLSFEGDSHTWRGAEFILYADLSFPGRNIAYALEFKVFMPLLMEAQARVGASGWA